MDSLSKVARRRLYPSLTDPGYLTLRSRRLIFASWARQFQGQHLTVLDVGGRYQHIVRCFATTLIITTRWT
jgi:hypothetical protein